MRSRKENREDISKMRSRSSTGSSAKEVGRDIAILQGDIEETKTNDVYMMTTLSIVAHDIISADVVGERVHWKLF